MLKRKITTLKETKYMEKGRDDEKKTENVKKSLLKFIILTLPDILFRMSFRGVWDVLKNTTFLPEVRVRK